MPESPSCAIDSADVIEDRGLVNDGALFGAHERLQVKVPGFSFKDCLSRMQLRQLAPDVIRDVVVRFVESIRYEVFYAHTFYVRRHR